MALPYLGIGKGGLLLDLSVHRAQCNPNSRIVGGHAMMLFDRRNRFPILLL